jgi:hypothetical protein
MRGMQTIPNFRQACGCDVEESETVGCGMARSSFHDVRRDGKRRPPQLGPKFVSLGPWKRLRRNAMDLDEQIIGTLPGYEFVVGQGHRRTS